MSRQGTQPDLFIVGLNIDKHEGHFGRREGSLVSLAHGMYMRQGADLADTFRTYGFRMAAWKFKDAAITHSCAWYRRPVELYAKNKLKAIKIFIGGDFYYKAYIGEAPSKDAKSKKPKGPEFLISQTMVKLDFHDPSLYERSTFVDPLGEFQMFCATPEMTAIHMMEVNKLHPEKRLDGTDLDQFVKHLLDRHGGDPYAVLAAVDEVSKRTDASGEFNRFVKLMLPMLRAAA
jgi:hypothetical protein